MNSLSEQAQERLLGNILKGEKNRFIFSGCGTSGRTSVQRCLWWCDKRPQGRVASQTVYFFFFPFSSFLFLFP